MAFKIHQGLIILMVDLINICDVVANMIVFYYEVLLELRNYIKII